MSIGTRLRALRKAAGWTQAELAKRAGVKQPSISLIETGETAALAADTLLAVARAFKVDTEWLYSGEGSPLRRVPSDDEARVLALYRELTPEHRAAWLAAGNGLLAVQPPSAGNPFPKVPKPRAA